MAPKTKRFPRGRPVNARSEFWSKPGFARALEVERKRLGSTLRAHRQRRSLSLEEAAEAVGIHYATLQRLEAGKIQNVGMAVLVAVCRAYGLSVGALFQMRAS